MKPFCLNDYDDLEDLRRLTNRAAGNFCYLASWVFCEPIQFIWSAKTKASWVVKT